MQSNSEFYPALSVHQEYWECMNSPVYEYDPTDDGPECEIIKAIFSTHTLVDLLWEDIEFGV